MDFNELFRHAQKGDTTAQERLFAGLSDRFRHFAHLKIWEEADVEEVVQEALLTIARELPGLEITTSFAAWAHKVLQHRILSYYKSKKGQEKSHVENSAEDTAVSHDLNPDLKRQLIACLRELLAQNRRYTQILSLHYQGFTQAEICEKMLMTPNAYYILLSRARSTLRGCLERNGWRV